MEGDATSGGGMWFNIKSHSVKWVEHDALQRGGNMTLIRKSCRALHVPHLSGTRVRLRGCMTLWEKKINRRQKKYIQYKYGEIKRLDIPNMSQTNFISKKKLYVGILCSFTCDAKYFFWFSNNFSFFERSPIIFAINDV